MDHFKMEEEPLFLFEDDKHYQKLEDIAKSLVLKDEKVSKDAVFLKQILRAAMKPNITGWTARSQNEPNIAKGMSVNKSRSLEIMVCIADFNA